MAANKPPTLKPEQVVGFILKAHADLNRVRELLQQESARANASWDCGGGDWETGLGAATHMGRRDIALCLLESGARLDVFAAVMLRKLESVQAALESFPDSINVKGPHGIPLIAHAKAGGREAGRSWRIWRQGESNRTAVLPIS